MQALGEGAGRGKTVLAAHLFIFDQFSLILVCAAHVVALHSRVLSFMLAASLAQHPKLVIFTVFVLAFAPPN